MEKYVFSFLLLLFFVPLSIAGAKEATKVPEAIENDLKMPKGQEQNKALTKDIAAWVKKEPLVVLAWVSREAPKELSNLIGPQVIAALAPSNGKIAADWLIENFGPPDYWRLHQLLVAWPLSGDKIEAAAWCLKAPADARYLSFFSVADGLCRKNPPAAADWALKIKAESDRLAAIDGVTIMWARGDFAKATEWIKTLEPAEAGAAARMMLSEWKHNKQASGEDEVIAKKKWIDQLPLSGEIKEALLKPPPVGRNKK